MRYATVRVRIWQHCTRRLIERFVFTLLGTYIEVIHSIYALDCRKHINESCQFSFSSRFVPENDIFLDV